MALSVSAVACLCAGLLAVAASLLAAALAWLWAFRPRTSAPGPPTLPLLGNVRPPVKFPLLLHGVRECHRRYGDIYRYYVGPKLFIVISRPEDVRKVLASTKTRERDPYFMHVLRTLISDGLITCTGDTWRRHRKAIEPAFHYEVLTKLMGTFNGSGLSLCEKLAETAEATVDVYPMLMVCALRTIMKAMFGVELDRLEPDRRKHSRIAAIRKMSAIVVRPWKTITGAMWLSAEGRAVKRNIAEFRSLVKRGLAIARDGRKADGVTPLVHFLSEQKPGQHMTEEEMYNEIRTLALSAVETTAASMGFTLALLGLHPEWQDAAQRQLDDVFGSGGDYLRPATAADLSRLTVIDAIVKESLRLFPTIPNMSHLVTEDTPLCDGRYLAPRGCCVLVSFLLMHRRPDLFPEPDLFDPGRFLPGGSATCRQPGSYLPFGTGSRKCVGARFADLEMRVALAAVLRRFRIRPGSTREQLEQIPFSITAHPLTGYRVSCVLRDNVAVASSWQDTCGLKFSHRHEESRKT
ncbi:cytochrome P450 4C1-like [Schistocerca serialis cubense]|uniref:cytochrome P450 4C1-like n=1 Tax=Schistocerca serialis cubense TaxID=2023355 RepID=UPI00214E8651|nr:cytochrome P450 4C1-like [Schistocerca serialis cubense]